MPFSDKTFDQDVRDYLIKHRCGEYLDVGPGAGKYGAMILSVNPNAYIEAVEPHFPYFEKFNLRETYSDIYLGTAREFIKHRIKRSWGMVIMGDVLEHMWKSEGLDVLHFFAYRCRYMVVVYPLRRPQPPVDGVEYEAHVSSWSAADFACFDHILEHRDEAELVFVRGFVK